MGIIMVYKPTNTGWWWLEHGFFYDFPETVGNGMSSSHLTNSYFSRWLKPPTRCPWIWSMNIGEFDAHWSLIFVNMSFLISIVMLFLSEHPYWYPLVSISINEITSWIIMILKILVLKSIDISLVFIMDLIH